MVVVSKVEKHFRNKNYFTKVLKVPQNVPEVPRLGVLARLARK